MIISIMEYMVDYWWTFFGLSPPQTGWHTTRWKVEAKKGRVAVGNGVQAVSESSIPGKTEY